MSFYGSDFATKRRNRLQRYQDALARIAARRQGAQNLYSAGSSQIALEKPKELSNVLNNYAGRGMAFSSGYGKSVQDTETSFANQLANLAAQRNAALTESQLEESDETSRYSYDLSDLSSQQADYESEREREQVAALAEQQQQQAQLALTQAQAAAAANKEENGRSVPGKKKVIKRRNKAAERNRKRLY